MGLLSHGAPLSWDEAKLQADHVRKNGIEQFLSVYRKLKDRQNDFLKWGDEVEYFFVKLNDKEKAAKLSLNSTKYLEILNSEEEDPFTKEAIDSLWRPEYASYMIESTPGTPYGHDISNFLEVEESMMKRRRKIKAFLEDNEYLVTLTNFPRLGCRYCSDPPCEPYGPIAKSIFIPDEFINLHPRFETLTKSIRERRGSKVNISVPIFHDKFVVRPFREPLVSPDGVAERVAKPDTIYMDAMCFGMGCSCLQMTFQACSLSTARYLYDQLAVMSPIMLALSAGSPIYRGFLADVDCRWNVIAQSVDDRTEEELGQIPLANNKFVINKSRYDSIDCFISPGPFFKHAYNDLRLVKDDLVYNRLVAEGVDDLLAQHVAHLFIRDPLVVYKESLHQDNEAQSEHFENIQSTNWQTVRFKPPPPGSSIGWRVEFRPMEVQMSDFENAAYVVFVVLLTRVFLSFNLNLYLPISLIDENIQNAQKRDAVNSGLFHFRTILTAGSCGKETELMTLDKIINGEGDFLGLVPLIFIFLDSITIDLHTRFRILQYLSLISKRAKGELLTTAAYLRKFVTEHPDYKHDSVVSERINYDLVKMAVSVGEGEIIPELVGDCYKKNMCFKESREQK